ncbi:MAG: alpha/beta hydrolase [Clostridia bacterium]|nr:alpha/beta hydrolase [Clostridia bacterium]
MRPDHVISTVKTPSFEMDYLRFGKGESVFVILPGLSVKSVLGSASAIARQYARIAEKHTVYLFDRRKALPSRCTVENMADDTAEAMDALGLRGVYLFGASQGGMIAEVIAIKRPDLVGKLILGSTACRVTEERFRVLDRWIALSKMGDRVGLYLDFGESIYPEVVFLKYRDALVLIAGTVSDEELRRFEILAEGMRDFDVTDEIGKIRCPVLVLGARDNGVLGPDAVHEIARALPQNDGTLTYIYDGFGHAAFDTAPDYCEKIINFIN